MPGHATEGAERDEQGLMGGAGTAGLERSRGCASQYGRMLAQRRPALHQGWLGRKELQQQLMDCRCGDQRAFCPSG